MAWARATDTLAEAFAAAGGSRRRNRREAARNTPGNQRRRHPRCFGGRKPARARNALRHRKGEPPTSCSRPGRPPSDRRSPRRSCSSPTARMRSRSGLCHRWPGDCSQERKHPSVPARRYATSSTSTTAESALAALVDSDAVGAVNVGTGAGYFGSRARDGGGAADRPRGRSATRRAPLELTAARGSWPTWPPARRGGVRAAPRPEARDCKMRSGGGAGRAAISARGGDSRRGGGQKQFRVDEGVGLEPDPSPRARPVGPCRDCRPGPTDAGGAPAVECAR